MLKPKYIVVGVSDDNDIASRALVARRTNDITRTGNILYRSTFVVINVYFCTR